MAPDPNKARRAKRKAKWYALAAQYGIDTRGWGKKTWKNREAKGGRQMPKAGGFKYNKDGTYKPKKFKTIK